MAQARVNFTVDHEHKIFVVRYLGDLEGSEINHSLMHHLTIFERAWEYDSIFDLRRYDGAVLAPEIEDLGKRWAQLAQGRDQGHFTAIISEDALVKARLNTTQSVFPHRLLAIFDNFDEGLDWIKAQQDNASSAMAV